MTPDQAGDVAARTLAAIDEKADIVYGTLWLRVYAADRERVESDLDGLRAHEPHAPPYTDLCDYCSRVPVAVDWPCPDARRYADGLRRTARLYGVLDA